MQPEKVSLLADLCVLVAYISIYRMAYDCKLCSCFIMSAAQGKKKKMRFCVKCIAQMVMRAPNFPRITNKV